MIKHEPLIFRKSITGADIKTNAEFLRDMPKIGNESVIEIQYEGHPWLVKPSEVKTVEQIKQQWRNEITSKKPLYKTKKALAAALGIDPRILNKRVALCEGVPMVLKLKT